MERQERIISYDGVRSFAIIGVVALHVAGGLNTLNLSSGNQIIINTVLAIMYCSVNLFGLLSGYLKIDRPHHNASLVTIVFQTFFWCFLIAIVCIIFFGQTSLMQIVGNVFPFTKDRLWYITCYFFVFLCAPYLNKLANHLTQVEYKKMLVLLFILMSIIPTFCIKDFFHIISHGYSVAWLAYMYLLGGYFKKYGFGAVLTKTRAWFFLLISVCAMILSKYAIELILSRVQINAGGVSFLFFYYCSPLTLFNSIIILYLFLQSKVFNNTKFGRLLTWISKVSLGIYIIHACPFSLDYMLIGNNLEWIVNSNPLITMIYLLFTIILIVFLTGLLDQIRIGLFKLCRVNALIKRIGSRIDKLLC